MRTSSSPNNGIGRKGVAALEFALCVPVLLILLVGLTELGRAWSQSLVLQKGLVAGAAFAARSAMPLSAAATANVENLVRRGTIDPAAPLLLNRWTDGSASLAVTTRAYSAGGASGQVIRVEASLPYEPLFNGIFSMLDLTGMRVDGAYEIAHVGN